MFFIFNTRSNVKTPGECDETFSTTFSNSNGLDVKVISILIDNIKRATAKKIFWLADTCTCTCRESVSLLTPLRHKNCDLPVSPPPKRLHGQCYSSTGEEAMKAMTAETVTKRRGAQWGDIKTKQERLTMLTNDKNGMKVVLNIHHINFFSVDHDLYFKKKFITCSLCTAESKKGWDGVN